MYVYFIYSIKTKYYWRFHGRWIRASNVVIVFCDQQWQVIVRFGGIVVHLCFKFSFQNFRISSWRPSLSSQRQGNPIHLPWVGIDLKNFYHIELYWVHRDCRVGIDLKKLLPHWIVLSTPWLSSCNRPKNLVPHWTVLSTPCSTVTVYSIQFNVVKVFQVDSNSTVTVYSIQFNVVKVF
jgi:hypothetical protein